MAIKKFKWKDFNDFKFYLYRVKNGKNIPLDVLSFTYSKFSTNKDNINESLILLHTMWDHSVHKYPEIHGENKVGENAKLTIPKESPYSSLYLEDTENEGTFWCPTVFKILFTKENLGRTLYRGKSINEFKILAIPKHKDTVLVYNLKYYVKYHRWFRGFYLTKKDSNKKGTALRKARHFAYNGLYIIPEELDGGGVIM